MPARRSGEINPAASRSSARRNGLRFGVMAMFHSRHAFWRPLVSRVLLMVRGRQKVHARPPRAGKADGAFPLAKHANSVSYAPRIYERGQDEKLSGRRRGDPRGVSQAQDRLHHVLARLGMVARLGGAGASEAREKGGPDLHRILA